MRHLLVLPVLAFAVNLAFMGAASAQTAFQADTASTQTKPAGPCPNETDQICGTANIAGHGAASWTLSFTGQTFNQTACPITYTANTDFTLASDGSTLALTESGNLCFPGESAGKGFPHSYGGPISFIGTWTVSTATGQFAWLGGSGTDAIHAAGAHVSGTYTGTLGP
jgi:hypothetical protein